MSIVLRKRGRGEENWALLQALTLREQKIRSTGRQQFNSKTEQVSAVSGGGSQVSRIGVSTGVTSWVSACRSISEAKSRTADSWAAMS